jgi:hypothetical protein
MAGYGTFTKWLPALNLNFFPAVDRKSSAPIQNDAMTRHGHSAPATFGYIAASELVVANPIIDAIICQQSVTRQTL